MEGTRIYCFKCGAENTSGTTRFCNTCGTLLITPEIEEYIREYTPSTAQDEPSEVRAEASGTRYAQEPESVQRKDTDSSLSDDIVCSRCGTRNELGDVFCCGCGARLPALAAGGPNPAWDAASTDPHANGSESKDELSETHDGVSSVVCAQCGTENDAGDAFCCGCGARLPALAAGGPNPAWDAASTDPYANGSESKDEPSEMRDGVSSVVCAQCGTENDAGDVFCHACGAPLRREEPSTAASSDSAAHGNEPSQIIRRCPHCGAENEPEDAFCCGCGTRLPTSDMQTGPAQQIGATEVEPGEFAAVVPDPQTSAPLSTVMRAACGAQNSADDAFCHNCGASLLNEEHQKQTVDDAGTDEDASQDESERRTRTCPKCGAENEAEDVFCCGCGAQLPAHGEEVADPQVPGEVEPDEFAAVIPDQQTSAPLSTVMCAECGAQNSADDAFCRICGVSLLNEEPQKQAADDAGTDEDASQDESERRTRTCPKCGAENEAEDVFCCGCGAQLPAQGEEGAESQWPGDVVSETPAATPVETSSDEIISVFCMQCGTENSGDDAFCRACGARLQKEEKQSETAETAPLSGSMQNVWKCPQCGAENEIDSAFCNQCGASLADSVDKSSTDVVCSKCGARNLNGDVFCFNCGTRLS